MRRTSLALVLCLPTLALAQPATTEPPFDAVTGSFFAISVPDLEASTRWYTEKLGLRSVLSVPKQPGAAGVNVLQGNGLTVEIQQHDGAEPVTRGAPSERQGLFKVGVFVKDFDATLALLRSRGVAIFMGPFRNSGQPPQVIVRDTSGTLIQFFGPIAQSSAAAIPPKRAHHAVVYDDVNGRVLVTGGSSPYENGNCCAMFNDLWSFDGTRWTALPSSGQQMSGMRLAFDSRANRVVSFGGWIAGQSQTSFRALERDTWAALAPLTEMPASEPGFVYDSRRNRFIAFGGSARRGQANGDTWEFDGSAWTKVASAGANAPDARQAFVMVFDERRGRTVVFGGIGVFTPPTPPAPMGDVWEFDGRGWSRIAAPNGPSPRHSAGATYDSRRNRVLVFGGMGTEGMLGDLWAWDGNAWTKLADASSEGPDPRAMGYLAYDKKRDRVVLFGGRKGWPNDLNDTWEWDGARWSRVQ